MVDVISKEVQLGRMAELYFDANLYAAQLQMHINYAELSAALTVFRRFRHCVVELYYLVQANETLKQDKQFILAMKKWLNKNLKHAPSVKYYEYSLRLFSAFVSKLVQIGVVEK